MDTSVVYKIIAKQMGIDESELTEATTFEDIEADSLDVFQIIMEIEEEFDMEFDSDEADNLKTLGDLLGYLKNVLEK
ncbi:MAG: acyl carrier protein [Firmicutes bacterium]|nr:acyl carrier protein [Bacillota bacterium]MBQ7242346.1 acyl carrier protein [Bacillota bacterium]MBR0104872.1 acyl carrier protein [Bacillota bacterium]MBR2594500.1 acyl carrier protein [Bacillota bacterium]